MTRRHPEARCAHCRMYTELCICALVPRLPTRTRLVLVLHRDEQRKPTNSGQLAAQCLPNSELHVRGLGPEVVPRFTWDAATTQPVLLYPHADARPCSDFAGSSLPVTLVVPDGTWRQAGKMRARMPGLAELPCVTLPPDLPTSYRLRSETHPDGLATLEAIARALGILDGPEVQAGLERIFRIMVERTLWLRGQLRADEVTGGVPEAASAARSSMSAIKSLAIR